MFDLNTLKILSKEETNNLNSKKSVFFYNLKEFVEIMTKKRRTNKKKKTQKMVVKKGTIREKPKPENQKIEEEEKIEEIEEYSWDDSVLDEDTFIRLNKDVNYEGKADNRQLDEYDLFYKEQF